MKTTIEKIKVSIQQFTLELTEKQKERFDRLLPDSKPRYIRCYDNGGETIDRYTVAYTGHYPRKTKGWFDYVGMNSQPFHGVGMHGQNEFNQIDRPTYSHLGKKIKFSDLPEQCQKLVMQDYLYLWDFIEA